MHFAFQIRATSKAKAKKAVERQLQSCGVSGDDAQRALSLAGAFVDALDAGKDQDYLVVLNGSDRTMDGARTDLSIGCSVYIVAKEEGAEPAEPVAEEDQPGKANA